MTNSVEVSIIVIGYNVERYIKKCLMSLIQQTYRNLEIIVVDDGSSDDTEKIIEETMKIDSRICLIKQMNKGILEARKTGVKNSKGKYIIFVDSDDWTDIKMVETYLGIIKNYEIDILVSSYMNVRNGQEIKSNYNRCLFGCIYQGSEYLKLILEQKVLHNMFAKVYRRKFLMNSGYLNIPSVSMGEDLLSQVILASYNPKVMVINEHMYYYFDNDESYSKNNSPKIFELTRTLQNIEEYLKVKNLAAQYHSQLEFLWLEICYYYYVIMISRRNYNHKKYFYNAWKRKKIDYKENRLCMRYINHFGKQDKLLLKCYDWNFNLGYVLNRMLLIYNFVKNVVN